MNDFDSLQKSKFTKRKGYSNVANIYRQAKSNHRSISLNDLQYLNINSLEEKNVKHKIDDNLLRLWGFLDMKSFVDAIYGNTINPYFLHTKEIHPIKDLNEYTYLSDEARILNLIDIKYIKSFELEGITFEQVYLTTFEILDPHGSFRPFVRLYIIDPTNKFVEIGYGYDSNNNGKVELSINTFNYLVLLNNKGVITSPLSGKSTRLKISKLLTSEEISKLLFNE